MGPYLAQPVTTKHIDQGVSQKTKIRYALCEMQGWRRSMEDQSITSLDIGDGNSLFAVFDGHGGPQVSSLISNKYLEELISLQQYKNKKYKEAFYRVSKMLDEYIGSQKGELTLKQLRKKSKYKQEDILINEPKKSLNRKKSYRGDLGKLVKKASHSGTSSLKSGSQTKHKNLQTHSQKKIRNRTGCTANVVLITPDKFYAANIGDSRSVLCRNDKAISLSQDHKPTDQLEQNRIIKAGGQIREGRINDGLNLSRCFGDFDYKKQTSLSQEQQMVIAVPDIIELQRSSDDRFILIGCDGVFEKFNRNQTLITRISNEMKTKKPLQQILKNLFDSILAKDTKEVLGCDNMTAILVTFI